MALGKKKATSKGSKGGKGGEGYDNTNRGVLFPNEKENENQPDYTGKINVDGVEKRLAAWVANSDKVGDYLRLSVSDFQEKQ